MSRISPIWGSRETYKKFLETDKISLRLIKNFEIDEIFLRLIKYFWNWDFSYPPERGVSTKIPSQKNQLDRSYENPLIKKLHSGGGDGGMNTWHFTWENSYDSSPQAEIFKVFYEQLFLRLIIWVKYWSQTYKKMLMRDIAVRFTSTKYL